MGSILPTLVTGLSAVNTIAGGAGKLAGLFDDSDEDRLRKEQDLALRQLQAQQRLQGRQNAADAALDKERIAADAQAAEEERRAALRRAVSRQNARFGSSGIAGGDGSARAVLLGLFEESEDELAQREKLDGLRSRAIDLSLENRQSLNVLQRSQLQERQRFEREMLGGGGLF